MNLNKLYCSIYCNNKKCNVQIDYEKFLEYVDTHKEIKIKMKNQRKTKVCAGYIKP